MDNEILLTELEKTYGLIESSNIQLDNKASNMIMIIGAMLSLQASFLFPLTSTYSSIICLISLISYSIALILFIKPLIISRFKLYPNLKSIKEYYEFDVSSEEYEFQVLGKYNDVIDYNMSRILSKGKYSYLGFYFMILGVVFTILTIMVMVVTAYV